MKVAVTGSDSFLAYNLIPMLLEKGHSVMGLDAVKGRNTQDLLAAHKNFVFCECDTANFGDLAEKLPEVDAVYHLAAISSERFCREELLKSFDVNVKSTLNILFMAKKKKTLFIFASSGSVYPESQRPKKEEEAAFTGNFYGTSKWISEEYVRLFNKNFDVPFVILRFSRLYGPRMRRNPVYDITKGLVDRGKITFYEGLESNYDFIYVTDAARALLFALEDKKPLNEIFNVSSFKGIKLKDLLKLYFKAVGFEAGIEVKRGISQTDILNNSKAESLGFSPQVKLEEGLKSTFLYFSQERI